MRRSIYPKQYGIDERNISPVVALALGAATLRRRTS
jgi:hypothetical protein